MNRELMKKTLVLVVVLLAAFTQKIMAQEFSDKNDVRITAIDVSGSFEVPDDEILAIVTSKTGDILSQEKLEEDLQRISDLGYFSKDVKATLAEYENGARVTFHVVENPLIKDIVFDGNSSYDTLKLAESIGTKKNKILNNNTLKADIEGIVKLYRDGGYAAAEVINTELDTDGNLRITISEGIIQDIKVTYLIKNEENPDAAESKDSGKTKAYVVTREMKTKPGDTYNTEILGKDLQRVYNLGFFEDVHTKAEPGDAPGKIILIVEVEETNTGQVGFGAGYSSTTGITGFLSLSERNLKGKGRRADVKLEFGGKRNNYELGYFEPWLDEKQTSIELGVYNSSKENFRYGLLGTESGDYQEIRRGFTVTVGRPISDYTKVFIGLKAEDVNVEPDQYDYLDGTSRSITGTIRRDTRDNVFNPTTGRYDSSSMEVDGGILGGDFDYQKLTVDARRFYPVRNKQVACFRVTMGLGRKEIPRFDYFDIGGVNTLRGYDEYRFAGTKMILYNAEYRFTLSGNLSAVAFADAGNTWMDFDDMDPNPVEMPKSVGIGIRLKIPQFGIGPIRLYYAYAITLQEAKIHFGFGHMF